VDAVTKIRNGFRLSVHLQPNHETLATNEPEYLETYALPFVFAEDGTFAGLTRPAHHHRNDDGGYDALSFSYNNALPYYAIVFTRMVKQETGEVAVKLMSRKHYRVHEFAWRNPGQPVFQVKRTEGGCVRTDHGLADSLRRGGQHYLVTELEGGRVCSMPVDISYAFLPPAGFEFRTESYVTSQHVMRPAAFHAALTEQDPKIAQRMADPAFNPDMFLPLQFTYFRFRDDGVYWTAATDALDPAGQFESLTVFELP